MIYIIWEGNAIFVSVIQRNVKIPGEHHFRNNCMDSREQVIQVLGPIGNQSDPVNNILQDFLALLLAEFNRRSNRGRLSFIIDGRSG